MLSINRVFSFKAVIYKVGINPCVDVPAKISSKLTARRGYIPVTGTINGHPFQQNFVPVKNRPYRLYVNGPMMKGAQVNVGDTARFEVEQDLSSPQLIVMPAFLKDRLDASGLLSAFKKLIPSRQKEIIKYMQHLKTEDARQRNLERLEKMFTEKRTSMW